VGEAISFLVDRVEFLEARLAHVQKRVRDGNGPIREGADGSNAGPRAAEQA
jgi:serine O-acetyltransferase